MKEEFLTETQQDPIESRRFDRARHAIGTLASGAYMLTLGPTARRVWGGALGATAGFMFTPPEEFSVGPLEGDVRFASPVNVNGGTNIDLSIAGSIDLPTHRGPAIQIHLNDIENIDNPSSLVEDFEQNGTIDEFENSIKDALARLGLKGTLFAVSGALIAGGIGALTTDKKYRAKTIAITTASGVAASGLFLGLLPASTINQNALEDAKYTGAISYVPTFFSGIEALEQKYQNGISEIGNQYNYLARLRDSVLESQDIPDDAIGIAVMSDQHCAQAGYQLFARLVSSDERIRFALSAGDHVDFGSAIENQICFKGLDEIKVPIVAISANHDGPEVTMPFLASEGVLVLSNDSVTIKGVNIYGYPDLSHSPSNPEGADRKPQEYQDIPEDTDILLAARPATARQYVNKVPVIVFGDTHKPLTETEGKTLLHNPGALEAGGLRATEKDPAGRRTMSVIYLDKESKKPLAVIAYDFGEIGQLELSVNTCTVINRDDNLKLVC